MGKLKDRLVGIYHFLGDMVPHNLPVVEPRLSTNNLWLKDGKVLVSRVKARKSVKASIVASLTLLGGVEKSIKTGMKVFVKPNFNSADPPPATTALDFLQAVLEILKETGANPIVGDCAGGIWRPTRNVFAKLGLYDLASKMGVRLIALEDSHDWVKVRIPGNFFRTVTMPRVCYESDRLVYLPCLKTHNLATYSGALKLTVGFVHPGNRRALHAGNLQYKIAEINLCLQPDLIIMDARKAFVTGGPAQGKVVEPDYILASGNPFAIDAEGIRILNAYPAKNRLPQDWWQLPQIAYAEQFGFGINKDNILIVEDS